MRWSVVIAGGVGTVMLLATLLSSTGIGWWVVVPVVVAVFARRRRRPPCMPELPLVVDLFAAALRGGALLPVAVEVAAGAAGPVLQPRLLGVARALDAGADAAEAWAGCADNPELAAVARVCTRSSGSGASAAAELERLARRLRLRRRTEADARSARAAVWVVLPLCLCFLPAFVLVGVVPMAVSLLEAVR